MIQRFRNTSINVHTYLTDPLSYFYCDCWRIEERKEKRNENKEEQIKKREEEITKKKTFATLDATDGRDRYRSVPCAYSDFV